MSIVFPEILNVVPGGNAVAFVRGGTGGLGLPVPFTIAPFAAVVTPNIACVSGWRSFAISCSASTPSIGGTHVFVRMHDPSDPSTVVYRREIGEFIVQDEYQSLGFGARSNNGGSQSGDDGAIQHLISFEFDNLNFTETVTVHEFDGLWCAGC